MLQHVKLQTPHVNALSPACREEHAYGVLPLRLSACCSHLTHCLRGVLGEPVHREEGLVEPFILGEHLRDRSCIHGVHEHTSRCLTAAQTLHLWLLT